VARAEMLDGSRYGDAVTQIRASEKDTRESVITSAELPHQFRNRGPGEVVPALRCRACPTMMAVACTSRCHRNDAVRSMWSIGLWVNRSMWLWIRTVSSALLAWHATAALVCGRPI
jgi:hypothetical protein